MAQQSAFGLTSLYDPSIATDQAALDRQMALAQALRAQSMTAPEQPTVPGARLSGLSVIAKALQAYKANEADKSNDASRLTLAQKQAAAMGPAMAGMFGDSSAAPAAPQGSGFTDGTPEASQPTSQPPTAQTQGERIKKAAQAAFLRGDNQTVSKLIANYLELTPEQKNMAAKGIDPKEMGAAELAKTKKEGLMDVAPANTVFDPSTRTSLFTAPQAPSPQVKELTETLTAAGIDPRSEQGQKLFAAFAAKQSTHQPATTVTVSTEKGYAGHIAEGLARQDIAAIDTAKGAPERITNARNVKALLDANPITGSIANQRLALEKVLTTAGLVDGKRVANTETLGSMLAASTLDAIKTSGLGAGQGFTDKDREFLEKARSGNITINASTLRTLAEMNERSGTASIDKANHIIRKLKKNPNMGGVGSDMDEITAPSAGPRVVDW